VGFVVDKVALKQVLGAFVQLSKAPIIFAISADLPVIPFIRMQRVVLQFTNFRYVLHWLLLLKSIV
jgi:hypothetical protein